jgi:predicted hotdog family 3-hydroxylacyl-ACP dehydratase
MNCPAFSPAELLPHSGAMIFIDAIEHCDAHRVRCSRLIQATHYFVNQNGQMPVYVGIEIMAQAVALIAGLQHRLNHQPPKVGFLLGTRSFVGHQPFFVAGQTLIISADEVYREENGMAAYDCQISVDGVLYAEARLSAYEPQNLAEFSQ